jgi:hypothetical protein
LLRAVMLIVRPAACTPCCLHSLYNTPAGHAGRGRCYCMALI